ncbi:MAG TPA: SDR family oxidoreductase [Burkholderiaceae bacterium]|nr:SDR family oxidoreductase [Burkholderiaceae bacterium]
MPLTERPRALVLGASGYVGTHLVPCLAARGWIVRAAARRAEALEARGWIGVETVAADALDATSLDRALAGIDVAYYLVHSMAAGPDFPRLDREAAIAFREAASRAGVQRIVYLGGIRPREAASPHLASRAETGELLRAGPVPVTELRAGMIIGPGSAAFEVIRDLVFHLPAMVTPRWVRSRSQPVALDDVLEVLVRLPRLEAAAGAVFDIGGPEVLTYEDLMRQFGELVGRRPVILPVPVLTPRLSSYWLDLVTAVPANVARALIEGLSHDVLADDAALRALVPIPLQTYREAARAALEVERLPHGPARASGATSARWVDGSMVYRRQRADFAFYAKHMHGEAVAEAPVEAVWPVVQSIGGDNGYYFLDTLWMLRGRIDEWTGGTGLKRGRRHPTELALGDAVDFWRVVALEPGRRLTLLAEMRLPGAAALSFELQPQGPQRTRVIVTAHFHPAGAKGLLYWHAMAPAHAFIFPGLARAVAERGERAARVSS